MSKEVKYYEFRKDLYFFDIVSSFSISLCGCPIIFDRNLPMYMERHQSLRFPGRYTESKNMNPHGLRYQAEKGYISKDKHLESCCIMLANTAYESVKQYNDSSEVFEFFRHVRNASSHLNVFKFNQKEPAHPAQWRGAHIDHTHKGESNPLYDKSCFGHLLGVADILELLMDIELKIIAGSDTKGEK